jgi:hypothetical protein
MRQNQLHTQGGRERIGPSNARKESAVKRKRSKPLPRPATQLGGDADIQFSISHARETPSPAALSKPEH